MRETAYVVYKRSTQRIQVKNYKYSNEAKLADYTRQIQCTRNAYLRNQLNMTSGRQDETSVLCKDSRQGKSK